MSTPVTRGELREELGELRTELRGEIGELRTELREELGELRTELRGEIGELRTELHVLGGALLTRIEQNEQAQRAGEQRLSTELTQHARALQEFLQGHLTSLDEKYADLPARVHRLESLEARRAATDL